MLPRCTCRHPSFALQLKLTQQYYEAIGDLPRFNQGPKWNDGPGMPSGAGSSDIGGNDAVHDHQQLVSRHREVVRDLSVGCRKHTSGILVHRFSLHPGCRRAEPQSR